MALLNLQCRRLAVMNSQSGVKAKIEGAFKGFPWNVDAHYRHVDVKNLDLPADPAKLLPSAEEGTALYKSFAEALYENDLTSLQGLVEPKFARLVSDRVNSAHQAIDEHNLSLRLQNMRGQRHQTELFLYDAETFLLCGDVSLDRDKNKPATEFTRREGAPYVVNGKEIVGTHIEHFKSLNLQAKSQLVVRLHFAVHSFINLYVWDPKKEEEVLGWKIKQINPSTKQSHFLTLDKILCEIEAKDLRHTKRLARYDSKVDKNIRGFSRQQGLLISDFDGFMPRNNPIVDFTEDA